ncbi:vesicle-associated membrane protein 1 isoform X2 [Tamandua tetradactyla]|uniref:vesicle-associated membrane protein 1 isoform X2 n=1 Tax=Tamandua tetradactyla TaxID=48850 RepID=UPI00405459AC
MSVPVQPPTPEGAAPGGGAPGGGAPGDGAPGGGAPGGGPSIPTNTTSNRQLQKSQAEVAEVVNIIRMNVDKVLERDERLLELDDRADALQAGASVFESSAAMLKRKYFWKNCKMMIILGAICAIIVVVIVRGRR